MKPIWRDGKLAVELHKPELSLLEKARDIGKSLEALHQPTGGALVAAIDAVLGSGESQGNDSDLA